MQNTVLWVYVVLLLIGGLIGFFKGKSRVSLIMSAAFAVLLILCGISGVLDVNFRRNFANFLMAALVIVFALRLAKTKKFMPAGFMLAATIVALALRNINF